MGRMLTTKILIFLNMNLRLPFKFFSSLKRISAIVILACFFLPLSQCTRNVEVVNADNSAVTNYVEKTDFIPASGLNEPSLETVVWFCMFAWPLFFQLIRWKWQALNESSWTAITELLLLGVSCYKIGEVIIAGTHIRYGGYLFILSASLFGLTCIASFFKRHQ